ncbi:cation:dicarboxylate symporter family transporter [Robiginitomaculum antarcticum]|uniref:cation:dicarboxylate symporter family transporter n=1 Tax=Robiginitomaculum antarcticum TaxID=437507 RepID=UPI0003698967|nr:cation:dicarboxylase symporter family transporter [Robiginitomaculum antarcticum]
MLNRYYNIPLLILVLIAAVLAVGLWALGADGLVRPIMAGETYLAKSVADLAKDALFVPLKPVMYALIILSIGASIAVSTGGLGAKFVRVLAFFVGFSIIGALVAIAAYSLFPMDIFDSPETLGLAAGQDVAAIPFMQKIYGVITSPLMVSIYGGILLGYGIKKLEATNPGIGIQADAVSDMFIRGFIKFLWITIPLAVFGSLTLALNRPDGVESLMQLSKLLPVYLGSMTIVWLLMIVISARVLGHGIGFMGRALLPQAVVAIATSSSMATLPATRIACDQLGANADEATPFYTIGATINMVGTLMGLTLISLYGMQAFEGAMPSVADRFVVAFQSLVYSTSAAGVPSSSIVLLQEILTSHGVSGAFATYVTAIIITLDTLILDRMRTMLNTQSDSMSTANGLKLYYRKPKILQD